MWALVAASAVFWGLKLASQPLPVPPQAQMAQPGAGLRGDLTRLLGEDAPPVAAAAAPVQLADARFALLGVVHPMASTAAGEGLALIAVDGKPPRAYRVGAVVEGTHVLQTVGARGATLGLRNGPGVVALSVPPPAPAATGSLPPALSGGAVPPQPIPPALRGITKPLVLPAETPAAPPQRRSSAGLPLE